MCPAQGQMANQGGIDVSDLLVRPILSATPLQQGRLGYAWLRPRLHVSLHMTKGKQSAWYGLNCAPSKNYIQVLNLGT